MHSPHRAASRSVARLGRRPVLLVALLVLSACGDDTISRAPRGEAAEKTRGETFELRPRWRVGQVYEVRRTHTSHKGVGRFPPAGEIESRSRSRETTRDVYREEILEVSGFQPIRTRRTYVTSVRDEDGKRTPTPVEGRTYEIFEPFGEFRAERVKENGEKAPARSEEQVHLKATSLRMAALLLPEKPVAVGEKWHPGHNLGALAKAGAGRAEVRCSLKAVREEGERRLAMVECEMKIGIKREGRRGADLASMETLTLDLSEGRILSYGNVSELLIPPPMTPRGGWRRTVIQLTVHPR